MAKTTRSRTAYDVTVSSSPPMSGAMTLWALRDFLAACDAAGIPDTAELTADHEHSTRHFTGVWVRHTFVVDQPAGTGPCRGDSDNTTPGGDDHG